MTELNFVLSDGEVHTLWLMESPSDALAWAANDLGACVAWVKS